MIPFPTDELNLVVTPFRSDTPVTVAPMPPEELAGLAEIAAVFGVTKRTAAKYTRHSAFPEPLGETAAGGRIWRRAEVERWGEEHLPLLPGRPPKARDE
jgi:hypothetical protein